MWRANDSVRVCVWKQEKDWHFVADYLGTSIESRAQMAIYERIKYKKKTIFIRVFVCVRCTCTVECEHSNWPNSSNLHSTQ